MSTAGGADVIVGAVKGNIVSAGGTITGDEVQLRASTGIGADGARVNTSANALAINNSSGAVFVSEADDVTLRNISLVVGGNVNNFGNVMGGSLDLSAGGTLGVTDVVSSFGGQTITAQNVNVSAQGGRTAQLLNTVGNQTITAGNIDVQTGAGGGLAEIRNNSAGAQTLTVTGEHLNVHGLGGGVANVFSAGNQLIQTTGLGARRITLGSDAALGASTINAGGDQTIIGRADISLTGGAGPVQDGHNAIISAFNPTRTQRIEAGDLTLANSTLGGNNSVAAILGANQLIDATGDVTLTANASAGSLPGVRIGGLGGGGASATGTNLTLTLDGDLVLTGGTLSGNGVGIGSTASPTAPALANNITINAPNGNVILNSGVAGSGVRIGAPQTDGGIQSGGNIALTAGGDIRLNGDQEFASIRTRDSVTLHAASITEAQKGRVLAGSLTVNTAGSALMSGPNEVASFKATSTGGDVTLNNSGVLTVTGMNAFGDATIANVGNVTVSGPWTAGGTSAITVGSDIVLASSLSSDQVILTANGGSITESGGAIVADRLTTVSSADTTLNGANQVATFSATSTGGDVTLNNSGVLEVNGMNAFGDATIANSGDTAVSGSWTSTASTSITTAGDLKVTSSVSSFGPMHVSVDGTLTVAASGTQPPPPPPTPDFPPF
ncbi:MAG TPA: hypothetical protein VFO31_30575, partial [Vicinamibacterales bacterium]|nr:hypothetical protein [Vicinamibacterales bacterium]